MVKVYIFNIPLLVVISLVGNEIKREGKEKRLKVEEGR